MTLNRKLKDRLADYRPAMDHAIAQRPPDLEWPGGASMPDDLSDVEPTGEPPRSTITRSRVVLVAALAVAIAGGALAFASVRSDGSTDAAINGTTVQENTSPAADRSSVYGWWDLVELDGDAPQNGPDDLVPHILIDLLPALDEDDREQGLLQLSGNTGCNRLGGSYTLQDGRFETGSLFSTFKSCGDEIDAQAETLSSVLRTSTVAVSGSHMTMIGDDGTVATFDRSQVEVGDGVYRLETVDGEDVTSDISLRVRGDSFSAYVGCFINGGVQREDDGVVFGDPVSMDSVTTTVPADSLRSSPAPIEPADALFGCERVSPTGAALLRALEGGRGVPVDGVLTITDSSGHVLVLRSA